MKTKYLLYSILISAVLVSAIFLLQRSDRTAETSISATEKPDHSPQVVSISAHSPGPDCCDGNHHQQQVIGMPNTQSGHTAPNPLLLNPKAQLAEPNALIDAVFDRLERRRVEFPAAVLAFIETGEVGDSVVLDLVDFELNGQIKSIRRLDETQSLGLDVENGLGKATFTLRNDGRLHATLFFHDESRAIKITNGGPDGYLASASTVGELLCSRRDAKFPSREAMAAPRASGGAARENIAAAAGMVPAAFSSLPDSDFVLYLDFDGELITAPNWTQFNGGDDIDAQPHPQAFNEDWVHVVWQRVAEDFVPFDLNVTTDRSVFDATPVANRVMAIITPTDTAGPDTGGVAFLDTFGLDIPGLVFNLQEYDCADTISHEIGHTVGLVHDGEAGTLFPDGSVNEYYVGHGSGETAWGAIMGAPFQGPRENVTQWSIGEFQDAVNYFDSEVASPNTQDDLAQIITYGFGYRSDDAGDDTASAVALNSEGVLIDQNGIIERNDDIDFFQFSSLSGALELSVRALDVASTQGEAGSDTDGANLAVEVSLYDSDGNLLISENPTNTLGADISTSLGEGIHYLSVRGAGRGDPLNTGFSEYASLGQYSISGILPSGPLTVRGGADNTIIINGDDTPSGADGTSLGRALINSPDGLTGSFQLINNGIETIVIDSIALDTSAFQLGTIAPITILPGQQTSLDVSYFAQAPGVSTGNISIIFSVPTTPEESFEYTFAIQATGSKFENDDNYEQNDTFFEPFPLGSSIPLENISGPGVQADNDWYRINVVPGLNELEIVCEFTDRDGNINIGLYDQFGYQQAVSQGGGNEERIRFLAAPGGGTYHIVVFGENAGNEYNLRWQGLSPLIPVAAAEDAYENNDILEKAFPFKADGPRRLSEIDGEGTQLDNDWYRIPVDPDERRLTIDLEKTGPLGNISIDIYVDGRNLTSLAGGGGNTLSLDVRAGISNVKVVVSGDNAGATYDLVYAAEAIPEAELGDDPYENNNTFFEAEDLSQQSSILLSNYKGVGVQSDPDWYRISLSGSDKALELNFPAGQPGGTQFLIYDSRGFRLTDPSPISGQGTFRFRNLAADSDVYYVLITGNDTGANYDFSWVSFIAVEGEDFYEENDTLETAFDLSNRSAQFLSRISGVGFQADEDWYKIRSETGDEVIDVLLQSDQAQGNLILELFDASGTPVAISDVTTGDESIIFELPSLLAADYFIRVSGDNASTQYDLRWVSRIIVTDDNYEPNNTFLDAFIMPQVSGRLSELDGLGVQLDSDFYRFDAPEGANRLRVELEFNHDEGDIDIALFDARFDLIGISQSVTDGERVSTAFGSGPRGTIYAWVYFANAGNTYDMVWDINQLNDSNANRVEDQWEAFHGLSGKSLRSDANEDGDRYPLWAEFAHGLDPHENDSPEVEVEQVDGYFEVTFMRNTKAMAAGHKIKVYESTNLRDWNDVHMEQVRLITEGLPTDMEKVTMRSTRPISETNQRFFRLSTIPMEE